MSIICKSFNNNFDLSFPPVEPCNLVLGSIYIHSTEYENLDEFSSITEVRGNIWIDSNENLINIDGLKNIKLVGGFVNISNNYKLEVRNYLFKLFRHIHS